MTAEKNMIDYIDWIEDENFSRHTDEYPTTMEEARKYSYIINQKSFLKSQPKLGDFVPTNEKGEVMDKPPRYDDWYSGKPIVSAEGKHDYWLNLYKEYQSALDRVIWNGWEVRQETGYCILIMIGNKKSGGQISECYTDSKEWDWYGIKTYEKLISTSGVKLDRIEKK